MAIYYFIKSFNIALKIYLNNHKNKRYMIHVMVHTQDLQVGGDPLTQSWVRPVIALTRPLIDSHTH